MMAEWIQKNGPGQQGFYQIWEVRDLSVFPCKRYRASVLLGPGDPGEEISALASEVSNAIRELGYHSTLEARSAYHKREADEVVSCYYRDLRDLAYNNPCARTLWSRGDDMEQGRPMRGVDETLASGIELKWNGSHDALRRFMDEEQGASDRWLEEGSRLRWQVNWIIDEAGHLSSAFDRGMLTWSNLEHRLGELGRWLQVTSEEFGRMPPPRKGLEHPVASLEELLVSAQGILLPFAPWARQATDPEDLSWFLEDAFERFHETEARVAEAWSDPR